MNYPNVKALDAAPTATEGNDPKPTNQEGNRIMTKTNATRGMGEPLTASPRRYPDLESFTQSEVVEPLHDYMNDVDFFGVAESIVEFDPATSTYHRDRRIDQAKFWQIVARHGLEECHRAQCDSNGQRIVLEDHVHSHRMPTVGGFTLELGAINDDPWHVDAYTGEETELTPEGAVALAGALRTAAQVAETLNRAGGAR